MGRSDDCNCQCGNGGDISDQRRFECTDNGYGLECVEDEYGIYTNPFCRDENGVSNCSPTVDGLYWKLYQCERSIDKIVASGNLVYSNGDIFFINNKCYQIAGKTNETPQYNLDSYTKYCNCFSCSHCCFTVRYCNIFTPGQFTYLCFKTNNPSLCSSYVGKVIRNNDTGFCGTIIEYNNCASFSTINDYTIYDTCAPCVALCPYWPCDLFGSNKCDPGWTLNCETCECEPPLVLTGACCKLVECQEIIAGIPRTVLYSSCLGDNLLESECLSQGGTWYSGQNCSDRLCLQEPPCDDDGGSEPPVLDP